MTLFNYALFWIVIFGLCLGSFFNVVILRSLSNESIVYPPSKCPRCGHKLFWWHNIPVLSYILLRGKCYFCKEKISIQYPIVEILTAVMFAFVFYRYGFSITTLFGIFFVSCFLIMTATDLKEKLVDCNIAIIAAIGGCIYNFIYGSWHGLLVSVLGLIVGALVIEIIARIGYLIVGSRAMGEADTYVAGALGAIFGANILWVLLYACVSSAILILPVYLYNRYKIGDKLTCVGAVLFTLSVVVFETVSQNYLTLAFLLLSGILLTTGVLKGIRKDGGGSYLPFVPALVIGAFIFTLIH